MHGVLHRRLTRLTASKEAAAAQAAAEQAAAAAEAAAVAAPAASGRIAPAGRVGFYSTRMTVYVLVVAIVSATGGMLFGYDIAVAGGVQAMASFQMKFFPELHERTVAGSANSEPYCKYGEDNLLQLFNSCMFLAGALVALPAGVGARLFGRKAMMLGAGCLFLTGAGLQAGAVNLGMLIAGRSIVGCGVGTAACVVPVYIAEVAPYANRGSLAYLFQIATVSGILAAQLVNFGCQYIPVWGWRLSLSLCALPALILVLGGIVLPESPSHLIETGRWAEGKRVLVMLRGTDEVDAEYADICDAAQQAAKVSPLQSWRNLFARHNLPMTVMASSLAVFQQLTGINSIMFYSPVIFESLSSSAPFFNATVIAAVFLVTTLVGVVWIDRWGRRPLLLQGGIQMMLSQVAFAIVLSEGFKGGATELDNGSAIASLVLCCVFVAGFAWSWGPIVWVLGAEIQTMDTRTSGMSAVVFCNYLLSFMIGQSFLSCLCAMQWGVFLFFAAWNGIMTVFVYYLLPETKGIPLEDTAYCCLFAKHPIWSRVMGRAGQEVLEREAFRAAAWRQAAGDEGGDLRRLAAYYASLGL